MSAEAEAEDETHPLDSLELMSKWGFNATNCRKCNKSNSECSSLLLQCGKCKKAYYCSMVCFNDDLVSHQEFCTTTALSSGPKASGTPFIFPTSKKEVVKVVEDLVVEEEEEEEALEEPEPEDEVPDDIIEIEDEESDEESEEDEEVRMRRLNINRGLLPELPIYERETVELRKCDEVDSREYGWEKPDWVIASPLRKTARGKVVLENGNLASWSDTHVSILVDNEAAQWDKPDWVKNSPLKGSKKGDFLKKEGNLASPVTHIRSHVDGKNEWEKPDLSKDKTLLETQTGATLK
jgi:hypothetical protein